MAAFVCEDSGGGAVLALVCGGVEGGAALGDAGAVGEEEAGVAVGAHTASVDLAVFDQGGTQSVLQNVTVGAVGTPVFVDRVAIGDVADTVQEDKWRVAFCADVIINGLAALDYGHRAPVITVEFVAISTGQAFAGAII